MVQESNFIILENGIYLNIFLYNEPENQFRKIFCNKNKNKTKKLILLD